MVLYIQSPAWFGKFSVHTNQLKLINKILASLGLCHDRESHQDQGTNVMLDA